jgi:single-strand DNA-binding protein
MSNLRNKVILIGHLGNDPEVKNLESGSKVANFSLATNDYYKDPQGERVENTQWHQLVAWNKTAEILEKYVKKGQEVAVEGKLTNRSYDDKEGNKRYVTEVLVNELVLLGRK